jgi:hypothetical protein
MSNRQHQTRRKIIFLLSSVLNDFDSYLPLAMALRQERPNWEFEFITFDRKNFEFININQTLMEAITAAGLTLTLLDSKGRSHVRWRNRLNGIWAFLQLYLKIVAASPRAILVHGRQFTELPYAVGYILTRLLGGTGLLLMRGRQPNDTIKLAIRKRFDVPEAGPSWLERLVGRDADALICFHDHQDLAVKSLHRYGRTSPLRKLVIGLPNLWRPWRDFIAQATEKSRADLAAAGLNTDEVYTVLAPKSISSRYMRTTNAGQDVFLNVLNILLRRRPQATILVRPHPRAVGEQWYLDTMTQLGTDRVKTTLLHPDVLIRLSHRVIAPNTSTLMTVSDTGRFIDCTDYPLDHYEALGQTSICDGYGVVFVNPADQDFEDNLIRMLDDAAWPLGDHMTARRKIICDNNPPGPDRFLALVENQPYPPALPVSRDRSVPTDA